ncbi:unnamed protein product [Rotaria sp. Silwood1]|nr:unnamed protein product [Rotaria sp. Silwood1]CAF1669859.1 unnamed protein product [Rotaria sp. Silwood1]
MFEHLYIFHRNHFTSISTDYKSWYEKEKIFFSKQVFATDIKTTKDFLDYFDTIEAPSATTSTLTTRVSLFCLPCLFKP